MASFAYTNFKKLLFEAGINLTEAGHDVRVILVMTNTTADTEEDVVFVGDIMDLDEYNGAAYVRKALANQAVAADNANNRGEFDADNFTWTTLGAGTRQAQAMLLYRHITNDADSPLIAYIDTGGFPIQGNGGDISVTINAEGLLQTI